MTRFLALLAVLALAGVASAHPTVGQVRGGHGYRRPAPVFVQPFAAPYGYGYQPAPLVYQLPVAPLPIIVTPPAALNYAAPLSAYTAPIQADTSCHASLVGQPYYALPQAVTGYSGPLAVVFQNGAFYHRGNFAPVDAILAQRLRALNQTGQLNAYLSRR